MRQTASETASEGVETMPQTRGIVKNITYQGRKLTASAAQLAEYMSRRDRLSHPNGTRDNGGRWHPRDSECCPECLYRRSPSRSFPWSLMTHCRTLRHIILRDATQHVTTPTD